MSDTLQVAGTLDGLTGGSVTPQAQAHVLTVSKDYLAYGWPDWSVRANNPLGSTYTQSLDDHLSGGSATIYNATPTSFAVPVGKFDVGNAGALPTLVNEFLGYFEDFAVYPSTDSDPVATGWVDTRSPKTVNAPTGAITTAWAQSSLLVYPPKSARYVVPQVSVGSVPAGSSVYLDAFDLRVVPFREDPTLKPVYTTPRNLTATVKPTRLNLTTSPDFTQNNTLIGLTITKDTSRAYYGKQCGHVAISATTVSAKESGSSYIDVSPGEPFKVSYQYLVDSKRYPSGLTGTYKICTKFLDDNNNPVSTVYSNSTIHGRVAGWTEISLFTTVPERATRASVTRIWATTGVAGEDFYVDAYLLERGGQSDATFFDGSFGPDYLWRQGGVAGATWSYYYQDRLARNYILTRLLQENVPLGMNVDQPQYGLWTP